MHPRALLLPIAVMLSLAATAASAAEPRAADAAEPTDQQRAKELFDQGIVQYRVGNFAKALELFKSSLKLVNRANLILNVAQCHRQLNQEREALFNFKLYLTEWKRQNPDTPAPYREEVDRRITELEASLEKKEQEQRRREEFERQRQLEREKAQALIAARQPPPPPPPRPFYKKWWFWTAVAVVVVAGATTATAVALQPEDVPPVQGTLAQVELPLR